MCGMQLTQKDDFYATEGPQIINELLPADIRVFGIRRATNFFHPQKQCDHRTYSYTTPTFVFAKADQLTNASFRITKETIAELDSILEIFLGTHNFFNYTAKRAFDDRSCHRYIISFKSGEPFLFNDKLRGEDVEFITITIKGQSFVLHQIRKMIGMVITVIRELQMKSMIQRSFEGKRLDVPMAPGLGLLLERTHYDNYDKKHAKTHEPLTDWGPLVEANVESTKFELITKDMLETELRTQNMMKWLSDLALHDFATDPEAEEPPSKSFVTMAAARANQTKTDDAVDEHPDDIDDVSSSCADPVKQNEPNQDACEVEATVEVAEQPEQQKCQNP